jgi:hypothetical protein
MGHYCNPEANIPPTVKEDALTGGWKDSRLMMQVREIWHCLISASNSFPPHNMSQYPDLVKLAAFALIVTVTRTECE